MQIYKNKNLDWKIKINNYSIIKKKLKNKHLKLNKNTKTCHMILIKKYNH
jgi:hypothetical protein